MNSDKPALPDHGARVLNFRRGPAATRRLSSDPVPPGGLVTDLAQYHHSDEPDDYRHRMLVNIAAFVFILVLIGAGLWVADTMAQMRKDQDCVLSGRRGCSPVDVIRDRPLNRPAFIGRAPASAIRRFPVKCPSPLNLRPPLRYTGSRP